MAADYSFCESAYATPFSAWHLRMLSHRGLKLGGGADTLSLCGRQVSWDLSVNITDHHLTHCCKACAEIYKGRSSDAKQSLA